MKATPPDRGRDALDDTWMRPDLFDRISECVANIGNPSFYAPFIRLVEECIAADQCMVFAYEDDHVSCLLSRNFEVGARGKRLAQLYLQHGYRQDPLFARIKALRPGEEEVLNLNEIVGMMDPEYLRRFYENAKLADKVAVLLTEGHLRLCVNFYWGEARPGLSQNDSRLPQSVWRLIARVVARHYGAGEIARSDGPLSALSDRERDVCEGILQGMKLEQTAAALGITPNSAATYRKRAYAKLGINSRAALFALCRRNKRQFIQQD